MELLHMPVLQSQCKHHHLVALSFLQSCWRTLLLLLGNKYVSEDSASSALQLKYENQKACLGLTSGLTQELVIFVKNTVPKIFSWILTITQQTGHTSRGYINPRFKFMSWFSIKMLLPSITNPTAQSEKDTPQTSQGLLADPRHTRYIQDISRPTQEWEIRAQIKNTSREYDHTWPEGFLHLWPQVPPNVQKTL